MASKYDPLGKHLASLPSDVSEITISFADLEEILGFSLPKSATEHRQWWANQINRGAPPQADVWLSVGFEVDSVSLMRIGGKVRFKRRK